MPLLIAPARPEPEQDAAVTGRDEKQRRRYSPHPFQHTRWRPAAICAWIAGIELPPALRALAFAGPKVVSAFATVSRGHGVILLGAKYTTHLAARYSMFDVPIVFP